MAVIFPDVVTLQRSYQTKLKAKGASEMLLSVTANIYIAFLQAIGQKNYIYTGKNTISHCMVTSSFEKTMD